MFKYLTITAILINVEAAPLGMILGYEQLIKAEKKGQLIVKDRKDFSAFSLDLRLGKLFQRDEKKAAKLDEHKLSQEQFIEEILEEVTVPKEGLVIDNGDFYLWQPVEKIFLGRGITGEITSRSSWARLGVRVQSLGIDAHLHDAFNEKYYHPLCSILTNGTKVLVKSGDDVGQLFVRYARERYLADEDYKEMVETGSLVIQRDGKRLSSSELKIGSGIELSLGPDLKLYAGKLLVPGNLKGDEFEAISLEERGVRLTRGLFFLATSAEYVEIPRQFVGYVTERHTIREIQGFNAEACFSMPFMAHANAPYIGPRNVFRGRITFENSMLWDSLVKPGMGQSTLLLRELVAPIRNSRPSRYNNQNSATSSLL